MPSILGIIGTFLMVVTVLWTHKIARILGPLWIAAWIAYYVRYRLKTNKPVFCNLQCNWDEEQPAILAGTGDRTMRPHPLGVLIALGFWGDIGHKRF